MRATLTAADHVASALARIRATLTEAELPGVVLTSPGAVAWATGGMNQPVDRSAAVDVVWLAVSTERAVVVTTEVELPRIRAEHDPAARGLDLVSAVWWDPAAMADTAADALELPRGALASDGHGGFGHDLSTVLTVARLALDDWEQDQLRALGQDAARAVEDALREWEPGQTDRAVAARIAAAVEQAGASPPVLLVGGDDRLRRFRHPVAVGQPLHEVVMAVLVAARGGQHVALTRYVATPVGAAGLADGLNAVRRLHRRTLAACQPGATTGEVLAELAAGYAAEGADGAWRQHYQGGPIGYAQREFELAPGQTTHPFWSTTLPEGCAVAWNPSLPGGAKDEDTFLVRQGAPESITLTTDWPVADEVLPVRPAVLVHGS